MGDDGGVVTGTPDGSGSATGTGAVISIGTGSAEGGPGSGVDPCSYDVMSYEEAQAFLESAGVVVSPSDDPSVHEHPWVVVYCPGADGQLVFAGIYQLGDVPDPAALQELVLSRLVTPLPDPQFSPDEAWFQIVGLQTWLWVDDPSWTADPVDICLGNGPGRACANATATAVDLRVTMGDGTEVSCDGQGVPYDTARDYESQAGEPHCFHVYEVDSDEQPEGRYQVTATTVWNIDWSCVWDADGDGSLESSCGGGDLGNLGRQSDPIPLEVRQYQAVITTGD